MWLNVLKDELGADQRHTHTRPEGSYPLVLSLSSGSGPAELVCRRGEACQSSLCWSLDPSSGTSRLWAPGSTKVAWLPCCQRP